MIVERISTSYMIGFTAYTFGSGKPRVVILTGFDIVDACGIYIAYKLISYLKNADVRGMVNIVPYVNELYFKTSIYQHANPLNIIPQISGSLLEQLSAKILDYVKDSDVIILIKCFSSVKPFAIIYRNTDSYKDVAEYLGVEIVVEKSFDTISSALRYCSDVGMIIEFYVDGTYTFNLEKCNENIGRILNILSYMKILRRSVTKYGITQCSDAVAIRSPCHGIFVPSKNLGDTVLVDDVVGYIDEEEVRTNAAGKLIAISVPRYVFPGDVIAYICT